jgi:ABC-type transport system involved in multi-copper enzyme maturation permease subunit
MYSTWHRKGTNAAIFALLTLALITVAPCAIEGIVYFVANQRDSVASGRIPEYQFHQQLLATAAPAAMAYLSANAATGIDMLTVDISWPPFGYGKSMTAAVATGVFIPGWYITVAYNTLAGLAVTLYAAVSLRRVMLAEAGNEGGATAPRRARKRSVPATIPAPAPVPAGSPSLAESLAALSIPDAPPQAPPDAAPEIPAGPDDTFHESARSRDVSDHPVLWREVRQVTFGSRLRFILISLFALAGLAFIYYWAGTAEGAFNLRVAFQNEGLHAALAIVGGIAVMIQPVFMTTGSIAGEREARTWDVLLSTPLSARAIIFGKFVGALRGQWFIPAVVLAHFVLSAAIGFISPIFPLHLLLIYLGPTLLFTATGQLFSLMLRRGVTAAVCNLLLAISLWLGAWFVIGALSWFYYFETDKALNFLTQSAFCLNPVAMSMAAVEPAVRWGMRYHIGGEYTIYGTQPVHLRVWTFTLYASLAFSFCLLVATAALSAAVAGFPRYSGRAWAPDQTPEEGFAAASRIVIAAIFVAGVGFLSWTLAGFPGIIVGVGGATLLTCGSVIRRLRAASHRRAAASGKKQ